jgi:PPOX class probable F420-dependent enzyme
MPALKRKELEEFLAAPNIARVATVRKDGSPFVAPVWYDWDGESCYIVGRKRSSWVENIEHEPRVTVLIDRDESPNPKVTIEGRAEVIGRGLEDWVEIGKRMVKKYFGPEAGESYLQDSIDQPRVTIKITPTRITSWVDPALGLLKEKPYLSWHPRYYEPGSKFYKDYVKDRQPKDENPL